MAIDDKTTTSELRRHAVAAGLVLAAVMLGAWVWMVLA